LSRIERLVCRLQACRKKLVIRYLCQCYRDIIPASMACWLNLWSSPRRPGRQPTLRWWQSSNSSGDFAWLIVSRGVQTHNTAKRKVPSSNLDSSISTHCLLSTGNYVPVAQFRTRNSRTVHGGGRHSYVEYINGRDAGCSELNFLFLPPFSFTFSFSISRLDVAFILCHCHACRGSPCCTVDSWKLWHLKCANSTSCKSNRTRPAFGRAILCLAWSRCSELHMFGGWDLRVSTAHSVWAANLILH